MCFCQRRNRLELNNHLAIDQNIGKVFSDKFVFEVNINRSLLNNVKSLLGSLIIIAFSYTFSMNPKPS